ncbi:helix-hairpin-helix domain-containing protein [Micromonospora sp. WMMD998]|uniref:helix-hairpin-helix domain-containing protein n=1 Tax=Micromonospora sp. WMMD998 TaxID=3016092 RepID=UPI00249AC7BF|nr:helix-hairpin-helix domain-containing protein [Micromonospora sp. WMMD998]WFE41814.1 helix-hairpin-helix domain-containing protein [Micromonospora sp. WMMD998]
MPDDEEATVRRRLARLFTPAGRTVAVPDPAGGAPDLVRAATPEPSAAHPFAEEPWGFPDLGPRLGEPDRSGLRRGRPEPDAGPAHPFDPDPTSTVGDADGSKESPGPARGLAARLPGPGAFDPGHRGVRALAAVAAVVVVVAAVWAWRSRPSAEPVRPVAPVTEASAGAVTDVAAPAGPSAQVVVAVAGKVRRPGLVRLPSGARLADALEAAGGALPGVDVALLNPARKVTDGELILVGVTAPPGQAAAGPAAGGGAPGGPAAGPVNLNTATLAQLDTLPGVGPVLAQRILDHREQHGPFRSVSDLRQVDGIGDARYEQLKELVTV